MNFGPFLSREFRKGDWQLQNLPYIITSRNSGKHCNLWMFTSNSFEMNVVSHYLNIISFRFCLSVSLVTSHTACWPVMKRMTQSLASRAPSRRSQILSRLEMHHWICLTSICYPSELLTALVSRQGEDWISYKLWQTVKFNIPLSKSHLHKKYTCLFWFVVLKTLK